MEILKNTIYAALLIGASSCVRETYLYDFQEMELRTIETDSQNARAAAKADFEYIHHEQDEMRLVLKQLAENNAELAKTSALCIKKARSLGARR
ncbi:MAG: hypothetical protein KDD66_00355 [Bdellovibrionales bacterium]|nr:hypothetical protein [Bdellovibrionales bacterium]